MVDEAHSYRGIFGSHVAHVLRRLRRICNYYGSNPQFVMCSATLGNPEEFLDGLTGLQFEIISETGAPQNAKTFVLWNPDITSPYTEATTLLIECLKADMKTIVFTKARKITELISMWVTRAVRPEWAAEIKSYRAGYLPEERREIESKLFKDELKAVISTSALEVGMPNPIHQRDILLLSLFLLFLLSLIFSMVHIMPYAIISFLLLVLFMCLTKTQANFYVLSGFIPSVLFITSYYLRKRK